MIKNTKKLSTTLLLSLMLFAAMSAGLSVNAQGSATAVFLTTVGGTTDPSGTQTYNDGQTITMTATPTDASFVFDRWIVQSDSTSMEILDNPATLTAVGGVTYAIEAVFIPVQPIPPTTALPDLSKAAYVQVLASAGGTTNPPPGLYALADATQTKLTATAAEGYQFSHWSISGFPIAGAHGGAPFTTTPTDNPYTVDHGYGNRYAYQAVFVPTGSTVPTPTGGASPTPTTNIGGLSMEWWIIIALAVILVIVIIALGVWLPRRHH
jgi:Divergent InlB B-repeat domain